MNKKITAVNNFFLFGLTISLFIFLFLPIMDYVEATIKTIISFIAVDYKMLSFMVEFSQFNITAIKIIFYYISMWVILPMVTITLYVLIFSFITKKYEDMVVFLIKGNIKAFKGFTYSFFWILSMVFVYFYKDSLSESLNVLNLGYMYAICFFMSILILLIYKRRENEKN